MKTGQRKDGAGGGFTRREFMRACAAGAAGLGLTGLAKASASPSPVNVLLILQDQLRYPAWFLDTDHLPGLHRLRQEGVWFTNHFTCAAPCSPSRATLQTGLHITQHGVKSNIVYDTDTGGLSLVHPTLGHRFQAAGYRTPYFGKWHLTGSSRLRALGNSLCAYGYEEWTPPDHVAQEPDGLESDPDIVGQAQRWLVEQGGQGPWFMTCSLVNPHDIMYCPGDCVDKASRPRLVSDLPANFHDALSDKPAAQRDFRKVKTSSLGLGTSSGDQEWLDYMNAYCYYAQAVDGHLQALLRTLDDQGLADDTLVILTSDHGEMGGSHQLVDKGPFIYQEAVRVPLVLRWPGRLAAGREVSALSQSVDIAPSLADLAGLRPPTGLPGVSLKPLLPLNGSQQAAATASDDANSKVHDHILIAYSASISGKASQTPRQIRAIFDGRYKYGLYFDDGVADEHELYDLDHDPNELRNLAGDANHASVKTHLAALLKEARVKEMGEKL